MDERDDDFLGILPDADEVGELAAAVVRHDPPRSVGERLLGRLVDVALITRVSELNLDIHAGPWAGPDDTFGQTTRKAPRGNAKSSLDGAAVGKEEKRGVVLKQLLNIQ